MSALSLRERSRSSQGARSGLGKVGWALTKLLRQANATVIGSDVDQNRRERAHKQLSIRTVPPDEIYDVPADIFAPCAMGGAISEHTLPRLTCEVIAGSANNQIVLAEVPRAILERGILYAPDYVINAGGLINVYLELHGYDWTRALTLTREIDSRLRKIFAVARHCGIPLSVAADRIVEQRLTEARGQRTIGRVSDSAVPGNTATPTDEVATSSH